MQIANSSHQESHAVNQTAAVWPLGRMMLVVFLVCVAVWAAVIYFLAL